jgi:pyrroloquinoline-quinone synthase
LLADGGIASEDIRLWISQQYYFSTQFPRCLAALFSRIGDYNASKLLIPFLNVEHWGSSSQEAHWRQFVKVLGFFELDEARLRKAAPFPETRRYLNYRLRLCSAATVEEALGCLGFAHELANERIFAAFLSGMRTVPGVTEDALGYFKAHVADEPGDYLLFREMTIKIAQTTRAASLVRRGALNTLDARARFFDRILERTAQPVVIGQ